MKFGPLTIIPLEGALYIDVEFAPYPGRDFVPDERWMLSIQPDGSRAFCRDSDAAEVDGDLHYLKREMLAQSDIPNWDEDLFQAYLQAEPF